MHIFWKLFLVLSLNSYLLVAEAKTISINSVDFRTQTNISQLVFGLSSTTQRKVFLLDNPRRLVIDFKNVRLTKKLTQPPAQHPFFKRIRSGKRNRDDLRVVIDLKQALHQRSFIVPPSQRSGYRLVVDVFNQTHAHTQSKTKTIAKVKTKVTPVRNEPKVVTKKLPKNNRRNIIVAIDAGHGGVDSGAKGKQGTKEKKVVLEIAKKLERLINSRAGMRAVMVRKGDYFIPLRKRMDIAREAKADLFISVHADAFKSSKVRGASVYTLSQSGASSEAAHWLANQENAADLVGGISLDDKDDVLASVLLDLSQSATKEASRHVASKVLKHFKSVGKLHQSRVQKAGFAVLKSPDIPSILVETAFISNPYEEKNLRSSAHQQKIATAIFNGVVSYFREYAPADTRIAAFGR